MIRLSTPTDRLRVVGWVEGVSYLVLLLIAMPLKRLAGIPDAVTYVGAAHGGLWILYLLALAHAGLANRWPLKTLAYGFIASVLPLGPLFFDRWLERQPVAEAS